MKKYRMNGNLILLIFGLFFLAFLGFFVFNISTVSVPFPMSLIFIPFFAIFISVFIFGFIIPSIRVMIVTKNGKNSYGTIKTCTRGFSKNGTYCLLIFKYRDEKGEESLCETNLSIKYLDMFTVGQSIPIFVKGKYAYPDLKRINNSAYNYNGSCNLICDNCGNKIAEGLLYCPKCGRAVEEMNSDCNDIYHGHKNYCPNCGDEITDGETRYCGNCGYKLK